MMPSRQRGTTGPGASASVAVSRSWMLPTWVVVGHTGAALLNARELLLALRPAPIGVAGSAVYLAAWLGYAFAAGSRRHFRSVRRVAVVWAVLVSGTAICGSLLRQSLDGEVRPFGGWPASALLAALAAPLYGLAGLFSVDALTALVGVALGGAVLTLGLALVGRWCGPAATKAARQPSAGE